MGYYINKNASGVSLPATGKAKVLLADEGAKATDGRTFEPNLVCVVGNGPFDAAGYCYSQDEFDAFAEPQDTRKKTWLTHPKAVELSGYFGR